MSNPYPAPIIPANEAQVSVQRWRGAPRDYLSNQASADGLSGDAYAAARMVLDAYWTLGIEANPLAKEVRQALSDFEKRCAATSVSEEITTARQELRAVLEWALGQQFRPFSDPDQSPLVRKVRAKARDAFRSALVAALSQEDLCGVIQQAFAELDALVLTQRYVANPSDQSAWAVIFYARFEEPVVRLTSAMSRVCCRIRNRKLLNEVFVTAMNLVLQLEYFRTDVAAAVFTGELKADTAELLRLGELRHPQDDLRNPPIMPLLLELLSIQDLRETDDRIAYRNLMRFILGFAQDAGAVYPCVSVEALRAVISLYTFIDRDDPSLSLYKGYVRVFTLVSIMERILQERDPDGPDELILLAQIRALPDGASACPNIPAITLPDSLDAEERDFFRVMSADATDLRTILGEATSIPVLRVASVKRLLALNALSATDGAFLGTDPKLWEMILDAVGCHPFLREQLLRTALACQDTNPHFVLRAMNQSTHCTGDALSVDLQLSLFCMVEKWYGSDQQSDQQQNAVKVLENLLTIGADGRNADTLLKRCVEAPIYQALVNSKSTSVDRFLDKAMNASASPENISQFLAAPGQTPNMRLKSLLSFSGQDTVKETLRQALFSERPFGLSWSEWYGDDPEIAEQLDSALIQGIFQGEPFPEDAATRFDAFLVFITTPISQPSPTRGGIRRAAVKECIRKFMNFSKAAQVLLWERPELGQKIYQTAFATLMPETRLNAKFPSEFEEILDKTIHVFEAQARTTKTPYDLKAPDWLIALVKNLENTWKAIPDQAQNPGHKARYFLGRRGIKPT